MPSDIANTPLSDDEYAALDALLAAPEFGGRAMNVAALEGFLTALVIRPHPAMLDRWLPWVFDMEDAETGMTADSLDDAIGVVALVTRYYNHIAKWMREDPDSFKPIYERGPQWGGVREWCEGFTIGTAIDDDVWRLLYNSQPTWLAPFMRLGTEFGREMTLKEGGGDEHWISEVVPAVIGINAHWSELRRKQDGGLGQPKVGRNDPCPCGSGKKYKKCCGAGA